MVTTEKNNSIETFINHIKAKDPTHTDFHQAVSEVVESVYPFLEKNPKYKKAKVLERIVEPDRIIIFRVC